MNEQLLKRILIGLDLLLLLVTIALWFAVPDALTLNISSTVATMVFTLILLNPSREFFGGLLWGRYSRRMRAALTSVFLIFCILGFVNYLSVKNDYFVDLTVDKKFSLSDQTINLLHSLESPLSFKVFASAKDRASIVALLDLFKFHKRDIKIEVIDPELRPHLVQKYNVTNYGSIVVEYQERTAVAVGGSELSIINTILKLVRADDINIYYTTGHDEVDLNLDDNEGGSYLLKQMQGMSYAVRPLDLTKDERIPEDADALLILGPRNGFLPQELQSLENYIKHAGKIFVALGPEFKTDKTDSLRKFFMGLGVNINRDIVVDRLSTVQGADATVLFINEYDDKHSITKNFKGRTIFPLSSSISKVDSADKKFRMDSLVKSSNFPASWAETDLTGALNGKVVYDEKSDFKGPVSIMIASEEVSESSVEKRVRIIASGNASFFINGYSGQGHNFNLFLNALSWLVNEDKMISLNRPQTKEGPVFISSVGMGVIFYFSVVFCPLILLGLGIFTYKRRQKM